MENSKCIALHLIGGQASLLKLDIQNKVLFKLLNLKKSFSSLCPLLNNLKQNVLIWFVPTYNKHFVYEKGGVVRLIKAQSSVKFELCVKKKYVTIKNRGKYLV